VKVVAKEHIMSYSIFVYWFIAAWVALLAAPTAVQICAADSDAPTIAIELLGDVCPVERAETEAPIIVAEATPRGGVSGIAPSAL